MKLLYPNFMKSSSPAIRLQNLQNMRKHKVAGKASEGGFSDARYIPLSQGKVAIVDAGDYDWLITIKWYAQNKKGAFYAKHSLGVKSIQMHRLIMKAKKGQMVDHRFGITLDNRKSQLRLVTHSENNWNRDKNKFSKSGYKGVYWNTREKKWIAVIGKNNRQRHIGTFSSKEDAAKAYDEAAKKLHGEFARLNFVPERL